MNQDQKKAAVARAAIDYVKPGTVIGVGTGSTVNCFIDELGRMAEPVAAAVSSSEASSERLAALNIPVLDLNEAGELSIYVDGADESDAGLNLIKGGGGAHTREKIVAEAAAQFVCIVDDSKVVATLGKFPLPLEVIPMAVAGVSRHIRKLGGEPVIRAGLMTDNGNPIIDVHGLEIRDPKSLEASLSLVPGVVTVGLFARRGADVLLVAHDHGVETKLPAGG